MNLKFLSDEWTLSESDIILYWMKSVMILWWNCSTLICHTSSTSMKRSLFAKENLVPCGFAICRFRFFFYVFWNNLEYREIYTQVHFSYIYVCTETNCLVAVLFSLRFFHDRLNICVPTANFQGKCLHRILNQSEITFLCLRFMRGWYDFCLLFRLESACFC
jgi:hypothetical protein